MRVTIFCRSWSLMNCTDKLDPAWVDRSFDPLPGTPDVTRGPYTRRALLYPVAINAPVGSQLVRHASGTLWLATHFNPHGIDAHAAYHLARKGERGFSLVGVAGPVDAEPEPPPGEPIVIPPPRDLCEVGPPPAPARRRRDLDGQGLLFEPEPGQGGAYGKR